MNCLQLIRLHWLLHVASMYDVFVALLIYTVGLDHSSYRATEWHDFVGRNSSCSAAERDIAGEW